MIVKESVAESVKEHAFSFRLCESVFSNVQEITINGSEGARDGVCFQL